MPSFYIRHSIFIIRYSLVDTPFALCSMPWLSALSPMLSAIRPLPSARHLIFPPSASPLPHSIPHVRHLIFPPSAFPLPHSIPHALTVLHIHQCIQNFDSRYGICHIMNPHHMGAVQYGGRHRGLGTVFHNGQIRP